jgi:glycosyltransferase involved in cell wall biosynthesis
MVFEIEIEQPHCIHSGGNSGGLSNEAKRMVDGAQLANYRQTSVNPLQKPGQRHRGESVQKIEQTQLRCSRASFKFEARLMRIALICTVYNEAPTVDHWIRALREQTVRPDEFVIVDGGSADDTVQRLRAGFAGSEFPAPTIIVQRCNIAQGRNLAIRNTTAEIIVSIDAGSTPDKHWFAEITRPFREVAGIHVVGGWCPMLLKTELDTMIETMLGVTYEQNSKDRSYSPSSRNTAYLRSAWEAVGGYPEWLTLTAEDLLFNCNLHYVGCRFHYQPSAIVTWEGRPNFRSFLKMMRSYGLGCGEVQMGGGQLRRYLLSAIVPPLILLSRNPIRYAPYRYARNFIWALGYLEGRFLGHKPPAGWQRIGGTWISPQAIATREKGEYSPQSLLNETVAEENI